MSGSDLGGRSSEENVATQKLQGEVHGAFGGQTELHQKQPPGPTHVPKDEPTAHLTEGSVPKEAQDINDEVEGEYKTRIQEAQWRLEHLSSTYSKIGLEGTTHAVKSEVQEKAQDVKGRRETSDVKGLRIKVDRMSLKDHQEGPEGTMNLTESTTIGCESESKLIFSCKYQN